MRRIASCSLAALLLLVPGLAPRSVAADAEAAPTQGLRYPSLTPDGRWVVFDYRGDIWRAPVDGKGHADRLTVHEAQDTLPRVSPDGTQVAFTSRREGGYDLYVMAIDGGRPRRVTFHSGLELLCDWSPDGKRLLFLSNREPSLWQMDLYEVALEGGTPRRLTRDGGREGCYALDGRQVVYLRGFNTIYQDNYEGSANYDVFLVDAAGGTPKRLFETPGNERWPFLSADGATVYFVAEERGVANLYKAPVGGGAREQVTRGTDLDIHRLSPSADRTKVVFERGGRLAWVDLGEAGAPLHEMPIVVQADDRGSGIEVRTITEGGEQVDVTRDGSRLAFVLHGDLWTMPGGGGAGKRLTTTPEQEQWPRFSPDGRRLAYSSDASGNSDLFVQDLATQQVTQVTKHTSDDFFQAWSPDGTRLVFASERSGNRDIWSIELATGKETQLTTHTAADDDPVYSPDGRWIAFDSARDGGQAIFVMPAEGGAARRVSQGAGFFQVPAWSPDGSLLVFEAFQPEGGESGGLFVASAAGGPHMQISRDGQSACWTRAGEWIYFHATRGGERGVWRVPAPRGVQLGERVPFLGRIEVDRKRELAQLFEEAWKQLKEGFYDPKMHGVDWNAVGAKYRAMAAEAETKETFYNIVNQMLAELGASHLGISPGGPDEDEPATPRASATGVLGLELAVEAGTPARKVVGLAVGGPAEKAGLKEGDVVTAVNGQVLSASTDLDRVLAGTVGKDVKVAYAPAAGEGAGQAREVTVKALAGGALARAHFEQWRSRSEKRVKEEAKGRVGYVHLSQMDPENLTRFQQAVARFNGNKNIQGMILDVRENGGGNIHVQLMAILQARPYVRMQPRGLPKITQPQLYWDKPIVVLVNERSFSDAEVFPWSFKAAGLGTTIGTPTPGGVIGTQDVTLSDGSTFRVPRVGWYSLEGKNLEAHGFVPDILVPETTEDRLGGRDPQLAKALEVVQAQIRERFGPAATPAPGAGPATPSPEPTSPEEGQPDAAEALKVNPLADARPGEWVRYRASMGGGEPTIVRYTVASVAGGRVTLTREVESGAGWLPPLPDTFEQVPLGALLPALGDVRRSTAVTAQVGAGTADGVLVSLALGGLDAGLLFTNAIPALGLLRVEVGKQVVMQALEWGSEPPAKPSPDAAPKSEAAPAPKPEGAGVDGAEGEGGAGGAQIDNPIADAKVGEWIRLRQNVRGSQGTVRLEVIEVTETEVVLRSVVEEGANVMEGQPLRRARTPRLAVGRGASAEQVALSQESLDVGGRSLACTVVRAPGRRGGPAVTTWYSAEVPVTGLVRRMRGDEVLAELLEWGPR